jgi:phage gp36-like protein
VQFYREHARILAERNAGYVQVGVNGNGDAHNTADLEINISLSACDLVLIE